jgi:hypothetical protein
LEVYHQDRLKKDILVFKCFFKKLNNFENIKIGLSQVNLDELLKCPIRKTSNSYARVYDSYIPVDEIDESTRKPSKKIACLRVIIYLEDMGPSGNTTEDHNDEFEKDLVKENQKEFPVILPEIAGNNDNNEEDIEKVSLYIFFHEIKKLFFLRNKLLRK